MQVYNCLQPLMLCMSYYGTLKIIDQLCEDHDMEVYAWSDDLKQSLQVKVIHILLTGYLNLLHNVLLFIGVCPEQCNID